jgi:hypothetical protein
MFDEFISYLYDYARHKAYHSCSLTLLDHFSTFYIIKCILFIQSIGGCSKEQVVFPVKTILFLLSPIGTSLSPPIEYPKLRKTTDIVDC